MRIGWGGNPSTMDGNPWKVCDVHRSFAGAERQVVTQGSLKAIECSPDVLENGPAHHNEAAEVGRNAKKVWGPTWLEERFDAPAPLVQTILIAIDDIGV